MVTTSTGMPAICGSSLSFSSTHHPDASGIIMSSVINIGRTSRANWRASAAFDACTVFLLKVPRDQLTNAGVVVNHQDGGSREPLVGSAQRPSLDGRHHCLARGPS